MHDVGKAIDRVTEGTHTEIGADFLAPRQPKAAMIKPTMGTPNTRVPST